MKEDRIHELMQLDISDELNTNQSAELKQLLAGSEELKREYEELRKFSRAIAAGKPADPNEDMLIHSRQNLMRKIRTEYSDFPESGVWQKLSTIFSARFKFAFGTAFALVIGIFLGQYFSSPAQLSGSGNGIVDVDEFTPENFKIKNVRFVDNFTRTGEVEFLFDAVKPVHYKGNMNDVAVQRILASALVTDNNPGSKLRTINRFAEQSLAAENFVPDNKVKEALIFSLKNDENPGVRRQALNVLLNYPLDTDIRDAFLQVLSTDDNSGLRVASINALAEYTNTNNQLDNKTRDILNSKAQSDNNDFIRLRAASLLMEEK